MEASTEPTQVVVTSPSLSLVEIGRQVDQFTARTTFTRYQERLAADTLRRHRADLAVFATYLQQIPGRG